MSEFDILRAAAAGMDAQRAALELAARNVAAAEASSGAQTFSRLVPRYEVSAPPALEADGAGFDPPADPFDDADSAPLPVRYLGARPEPGVEADAVSEMVAVLNAQRNYEANASLFDAGKRLAERTIDVGRL
jgi:flagellar basal body rod protein FlgC